MGAIFAEYSSARLPWLNKGKLHDNVQVVQTQTLFFSSTNFSKFCQASNGNASSQTEMALKLK